MEPIYFVNQGITVEYNASILYLYIEIRAGLNVIKFWNFHIIYFERQISKTTTQMLYSHVKDISNVSDKKEAVSIKSSWKLCSYSCLLAW